MVKVYFEKKGYCELVAIFNDEQTYIACLPGLEKQCEKNGFEFITESVEEIVSDCW